MRLSEAAGLSKGDVYLDEEVPYVDIKPHSVEASKDSRESTQGSIGWYFTLGS